MPYNTGIPYKSEVDYTGLTFVWYIQLIPPSTVQQALRVQWRVFGVFVCFDLYFVNYRSWQAEIL